MVTLLTQMPDFNLQPNQQLMVFRVLTQGPPSAPDSYHHKLYVMGSTMPPSGIYFHVLGSLQSGFYYREENVVCGPDSSFYVGQEYIGTIVSGDVGRLRRICRSVEVPRKQIGNNGRLYPHEPLRGDQEWVSECVERLVNENILVPAQPAQYFGRGREPTSQASQGHFAQNSYPRSDE